MFAVIFKAEIQQLDDEYIKTAGHLRQLAFEKYGCSQFDSYTEGGREVAISYWSSLEDIQAWKADPEHRAAQRIGQRQWYTSYEIEIVEVVKQYRSK